MGIHNAVEVVGVPPRVVAVVEVILASHSMNHVFFPESGHMHDSIYLHA